MSSGSVVALALSRQGAIADWRELMGPTNSHTARETVPSSLRARFGTDQTMNACHGSDSKESAARELQFYFPKLQQTPLPTGAETRKYIKAHLGETLQKGLVHLCKEKPSADRAEALEFLGRWLLENNPNKPHEVAQEALELDPANEDDEASFFQAMKAASDAASDTVEEEAEEAGQEEAEEEEAAEAEAEAKAVAEAEAGAEAEAEAEVEADAQVEAQVEAAAEAEVEAEVEAAVEEGAGAEAEEAGAETAAEEAGAETAAAAAAEEGAGAEGPQDAGEEPESAAGEEAAAGAEEASS